MPQNTYVSFFTTIRYHLKLTLTDTPANLARIGLKFARKQTCHVALLNAMYHST